MDSLQRQLTRLGAARLRGMRRGIEREGLRVLPGGVLSTTPHPQTLGAALCHPHITTDFSESQLELITSAHTTVEACLGELTEIHQFVARALAPLQESLWGASLPARLPAHDDIPLARYGESHAGRLKTIYRQGLSWRYGRRMQTISGIHYNWSLPGLGNEDYFALIRNFRRHAFVPLVLFGASPALDASFLDGQAHRLQPLPGNETLHLPWATSLRMGRLGYQSDTQTSIPVSYNSLADYAGSLRQAMATPWPAYERIGVRGSDGEYRQLSTSVLQIENEFYGTIRPKRTPQPGERPLQALTSRGVEYVEVRIMDLDPFDPIGITARTARFLDVFLLHCLLRDSPQDTPQEIAEIRHNQHLAAEEGRRPDLQLQRDGREVRLVDWAGEVLAECAVLARALDELLADGGTPHADAVREAQARLGRPESLPSSRVLAEVVQRHAGSFIAFGTVQAERARDQLLALPWSAEQQARQDRQAAESLAEAAQRPARDTVSFEQYLADYLAAGQA